MAQSKSSKRWLNEHFSDEYVKRAHAQNYRSRAVFKLQEIDQRDRVFTAGMRVLDLGAAPGGWTQYARKQVGDRGTVIALDLLKMDPIPGVEVIQGDFREEFVLQRVYQILDRQKLDLILSDMAPNQSGIAAVDQPKSIYLAELALDLAETALQNGGGLLVKTFQGIGFDSYYKKMKQGFTKVVTRKPKASRTRSREVYLFARGFKSAG